MDRKVAMLGGSFDPVHLGHLFLLHCAVSMTDYDMFVVVPAALSNFKQSSVPKASDDDRLAMLRLALLDFKDLYPQDSNANMEISTMELERGGVSYTFDTVMALKAGLGIEGRLGLIMGDDQIPALTKWYRYDSLKDEVEFVVCRRNKDGSLWDMMPKGAVYKKIEPEELSPESSSGFRANSIGNMGFLPRRVSSYVMEHGLYD